MPRKLRQPGNSDWDVLNELKLEFFTADPAIIRPFDNSKLSWSVDVPPRVEDVQFSIGGQSVGKKGEQLVQPASSQTYYLKAQYHSAVKDDFGIAAVSVNLSACGIQDIFPLERLLSGLIQQAIATMSGISPKGSTQIQTTSDSITINIPMSKSIAVLGLNIEADVTIDVSFGLAIVTEVSRNFFVNRQIAATNEEINAELSVPFYVWLIPGSLTAVPEAMIKALGDIQKAGSALIDGIIEFFNDFPDLQNPPNFEPENVTIIPGGPSESSTVEVTKCPPPTGVVVR